MTLDVTFFTYESIDRPSTRVRGYGFAKQLERRQQQTKVISLADRFQLSNEQPYQLWDIQKIYYNGLILKELVSSSKTMLYLQKVSYHVLAAVLYRWITRAPLIIDYDDWDFEVQPFRTCRLLGLGNARSITRAAFQRAAAIIVSSHHLHETAKRLIPAGKPLFLLPTGVDTELFHPPSEISVLSEVVTFCWTGLIWNDEMFENIRFLAATFSSMSCASRCRLLIAGNYSHYSGPLHAIARQSFPQREIQLPGWLSPHDIPTLLQKADVGLFILTKPTNYNRAKSPTKLFEYMAMGLPVVAGFYGELEHVVESGETGFVASDAVAYKAAMELLADSPDLRQTMGRKASAIAQQSYSLINIGAQLETILQSLV